MPDLFDELNEDLRAERARALAKRYGLLAAVVLLIVLAGVGGWKGWEWRGTRQAEAAAGPYFAAMHQADSLQPGPDPARVPAADAFAQVAATAPEGYRSLARLREAGLRWDAGDTAAALALWDQVAADKGADSLLRDLATLLWAQHSVDKGNPAAVRARTASLQDTANPWRPLAQEVDAMLALRTDDRDQATRILRGLTADPAAPPGLRQRALGVLVQLGAVAETNG